MIVRGVLVSVPEMKNSDVTDVEVSTGSQADTGWNRHVAEILNSVNDLQLLLPTLVNAIDSLTPNSTGSSGVLLFAPREHGHDIWSYPDSVERYDRAHQFDPFPAAVLRGELGCRVLRDVAPAGFENSAFYESVYLNEGFKDEVVHSCKLDSTYIIAGRMFRNRLTHREIEAHRGASVVIQAAARHAVKLLLSTDQSQLFEPIRSVKYALAHFGGDVLTPREQDVIHLILQGHNTESITYQLDISANTIKRHRSNAYRKLAINSQGELFSRFLASLGKRTTG